MKIVVVELPDTIREMLGQSHGVENKENVAAGD